MIPPTTTLDKILLSVGLIVAVVIVRTVLSWLLTRVRQGLATDKGHEKARFWTQQAVAVLVIVTLVGGLAYIWLYGSGRLASAAGLVTAGIAVALQRVITAFAAYLIILRGRVFSVGDRITMGGVRGDVIALGFMQTTVMEMGEPPAEQADAPAVWVRGRQYTGRLVRVTNDKIFDSPVYNYTREFPFVWEEMHVPIKFDEDRDKVEQILLEIARKHTADLVEEAKPALVELRKHYFLPDNIALEPVVFVTFNDNWVELSLRFISRTHGARTLKDRMSRDMLEAFTREKIGIASGTYEIVGVPPIRVDVASSAPAK